jgi:hypothetical protein
VRQQQLNLLLWVHCQHNSRRLSIADHCWHGTMQTKAQLGITVLEDIAPAGAAAAPGAV